MHVYTLAALAHGIGCSGADAGYMRVGKEPCRLLLAESLAEMLDAGRAGEDDHIHFVFQQRGGKVERVTCGSAVLVGRYMVDLGAALAQGLC